MDQQHSGVFGSAVPGHLLDWQRNLHRQRQFDDFHGCQWLRMEDHLEEIYDVANVPFPGRAWADAGTTYQFRIDVDQSNLQGVIGTVVAQIDVPDKTIRLPDVVIATGGTRLAIGSGWRNVVIVSLTLHSDGGSATTARVVDKSTSGPLIQCFNASGAATAGTVDAYVQGY